MTYNIPTCNNPTYDVYNNDFQKIGVVQADSAEAALIAAKKRFPLVPAPMVQPTPVPSRVTRNILRVHSAMLRTKD
jgi:hypothetical protein